VSALEVQGLSRRFGSRVALSGLNLVVEPGDIYGFLGPNGAGKTTALRCILGLIRADAGKVAIFGETDPVRRRRHVGALVETPHFYEWLSGRANLALACAYAGLKPAEVVDEALTRVGLLDRGDDPVKAYSLGMKQRLGLARAILGRPKLLLLDEPTNGMDPQGMRDVRELIGRLARTDGLTVLVSSHLLYEVEALATRVGILRTGKLVAEGDVRELLGGPVTRVEVGAPDMAALGAALAEIGGATVEGEGEHGRVLVSLDGLDAAGLNRALHQKGVSVEALVGRGRSLEDLFISLVGGDA
jgi:ABC-2 type transport system ATP-binding protein